MLDEKKVIDAVVDFPGGCKEQKSEFLKTLGLELPKEKKTVTVTFEVDVTDTYYGPALWGKYDWQYILGRKHSIAIMSDTDQLYYMKKIEGLVTVTNVEKSNG